MYKFRTMCYVFLMIPMVILFILWLFVKIGFLLQWLVHMVFCSAFCSMIICQSGVSTCHFVLWQFFKVAFCVSGILMICRALVSAWYVSYFFNSLIGILFPVPSCILFVSDNLSSRRFALYLNQMLSCCILFLWYIFLRHFVSLTFCAEKFCLSDFCLCGILTIWCFV